MAIMIFENRKGSKSGLSSFFYVRTNTQPTENESVKTCSVYDAAPVSHPRNFVGSDVLIETPGSITSIHKRPQLPRQQTPSPPRPPPHLGLGP